MISGALAVIPARLGATRLPRKPLILLADRPLIEWVWRSVVQTDLFERVVVATDSEEVAEVARCFGAEVGLTAASHPTGTDRIAELVRRADLAGFPFVVNIQGDEPFARAADLEAALRLVSEGGWGVGTVAAPIGSADEWRNPDVVKVVRNLDGGAMLFSRAPIPHVRGGDPHPELFRAGCFLRHIGIYAYARDALLRWVRLPEGELERSERLEQLRPLAAGIDIGVAIVAALQADEGGIDTPADAERADRLLRQRSILLSEAIV